MTVIDYSTVLNTDVIPILGALLMGLAGWAVKWGVAWLDAHTSLLNAQEESIVRGALLDGVRRGIIYAQQKAAANRPGETVQVNDALVADAAQYVIDTLPEKLSYFGITPSVDDPTLQKLVVVHLPQPPEVAKTPS